MAAALRLAERIPSGSTVLCMLPDTGERYLSTPLFEHIGAEMTDEELAISRSTASAQFGVPSPAAPATAASAPPVDQDAKEAMERAAVDAPVVLFSLEWCEFCWALRKLLNALDVPYRDVALDAVELQPGDLGGRMRRALSQKTGISTIPQLFIGGAFLGGCMDAFEAYKSGRLADLLAGAGVKMNARADLAPDDFLPKWLVRKASPAATAEIAQKPIAQKMSA